MYPTKVMIMVYRGDLLTHLTQPDTMACIPTCLAMLTGRDPVEVDKEFTPLYTSNDITISRYLEQHSIRTVPYYTAGIHEILNGQLYLATVPSLQVQGLFHQIIIDARFDHTTVYDPCMGIPNKHYYVMERDKSTPDYYLQFPLRSFIIDYKVILPSRFPNDESEEF